MNQIRSPVLVQLNLNRIEKILKVRKGENATLDIVENKIKKLGVNSSEVFPSLNKLEVKQPNLIKDKHGKKKSKTLCSTRFLNFNENVAQKFQDISIPEIKLSVKEKDGKKLHTETHLLNFNTNTIKDMIPLPEIKIFNQDGGKKYPCFRFIGFIDIVLSSDDDDDDIQIDPFISTINKLSSEIDQQQDLVTGKGEPTLESIKLNDTNTANMDEFNMCKTSILTNFSKKMINDASSKSITDNTFDPNSNTESISLPIIHEKFEMLKIIVFDNNNYKTYHKNIMMKLAMILIKDELLWKLEDTWHTPEANQVKIILEDILKMIFHMKNKNIIFMGCLSIIFRKTVVSHFNVTGSDLHSHFMLFTGVIEKCLMKINDHFWKSMLPNGWNIFCNGCLIVDLIIHGQKMSMGKYVNWNEIPSTQKCLNYSNGQPCSVKQELFNNKLEKPQPDDSLMPSISSINKTEMNNDKQPVLRKRSIDISSMSSTSNNLTKTLSQSNGEGLVKRKKLLH